METDTEFTRQIVVRAWQEVLARFWRMSSGSTIDIVCSEIPEEERPEFASPRDRT